jgi:hypothetical protein
VGSGQLDRRRLLESRGNGSFAASRLSLSLRKIRIRTSPRAATLCFRALRLLLALSENQNPHFFQKEGHPLLDLSLLIFSFPLKEYSCEAPTNFLDKFIFVVFFFARECTFRAALTCAVLDREMRWSDE